MLLFLPGPNTLQGRHDIKGAGEDLESEEAHLLGPGETQLFTHPSSHKSTINIVIPQPGGGTELDFSFFSEHAI